MTLDIHDFEGVGVYHKVDSWGRPLEERPVSRFGPVRRRGYAMRPPPRGGGRIAGPYGDILIPPGIHPGQIPPGIHPGMGFLPGMPTAVPPGASPAYVQQNLDCMSQGGVPTQAGCWKPGAPSPVPDAPPGVTDQHMRVACEMMGGEVDESDWSCAWDVPPETQSVIAATTPIPQPAIPPSQTACPPGTYGWSPMCVPGQPPSFPPGTQLPAPPQQQPPPQQPPPQKSSSGIDPTWLAVGAVAAAAAVAWAIAMKD